MLTKVKKQKIEETYNKVKHPKDKEYKDLLGKHTYYNMQLQVLNNTFNRLISKGDENIEPILPNLGIFIDKFESIVKNLSNKLTLLKEEIEK